jgi:hypothetical protein
MHAGASNARSHLCWESGLSAGSLQQAIQQRESEFFTSSENIMRANAVVWAQSLQSQGLMLFRHHESSLLAVLHVEVHQLILKAGGN